MSSSHESGRVGRRTFLKGAAAGAVGVGLTGALGSDVFAKDAEPKMQMRVFGRTKREVSVIGVGAGGINPNNLGLVKAAVKHGVNFIDTASSYQQTRSETAIGQFLKDYPDREKLFVNTKASGFSPPRNASDKAVYEAFKAKLAESLKRLQTDYVDSLMWPHGASNPNALKNEQMMNAFRKLKEEGLVKFFGTSSHTNYKATCEAAVEDGFYDLLLVVINICSQNPDKQGTPRGRRGRQGRPADDTRKFLEMAKKKDIGVMVMKAAQGGFLGSGTDALLKAEFPGPSPLSRHQKLYTYALKQPGVHTVIVGMREALHVREAVALGKA